MNLKKILASVLAVSMVTSMCVVPAMAETAPNAVIDTNRTGTINIHKIIENDGQNVEAYGLATDEGRIPVNNIGYDYTRVATLENVRGIVISDQGDINWDVDGGKVSVGVYYKPLIDGDTNEDLLQGLINEAHAIPVATYIKTKVVGANENAAPTIQYEYIDQKNNVWETGSDLSGEQAAVEQAEATLRQKADELEQARIANREAVISNTQSNTGKNQAQRAYDAAVAAQTAAQNAYDQLSSAFDTASSVYNNALTTANTASETLRQAQETFDSADATYRSGDPNTQAKLAAARQAMIDAQNALESAKQNLTNANAAKETAQTNKDNADAALTAADNILNEAKDAARRAQLGDPDSITGTQNAVAYAQNQYNVAKSYQEAMSSALDTATQAAANAQQDFEDAQAALSAASGALDSAISNNTEAYNAFKNAMSALNNALSESENATQALNNADRIKQDLDAKKQAAYDALNTAIARTQDAQTALSQATQQEQSSSQDAQSISGALDAAQQAYETAWTNYQTAVTALDTKAAAEGIEKFYTPEAVQTILKQILTTLGEERINEWVKTHTDFIPLNGLEDSRYTDDRGIVSFPGLPLGLYIIAETDISYHDGVAGAWNDDIENGGAINNDQQNKYTAGDDRDYIIYPINGHDDETTHTYKAGESYRESVNPEFPVIESKSAPFFVSVPSTNMTDTTSEMVAAGDNSGPVGTVWQYTMDVYPKNQTTSGVYLRIIDPDERDGFETLRTSEDYQIGDVIENVLWSEAPRLQPSYLDPNSLDGNTTGDRNVHTSFVLSVEQSPSVTFDQVTSVQIIPASQITGENTYTNHQYFYYDPDGNLVPESEAMENGQLKTITKYYDTYGHEVPQSVYEEASRLNSDQHEYSAVEYTYKRYDAIGNGYSSLDVDTVDDLAIVYDAAPDEGIILDPTDYRIIITDNEDVQLKDDEQVVTTAIPAGTHGFAVALTESGLEKLNNRPTNSVVVVYFDTILNPDAKIGQAEENAGTGTLHWINSNTRLREVGSNSVYEYTYELQIKKKGVDDASNVRFVISRDDTGDPEQVEEKDMTDMDSYNGKKNPATGSYAFGADDSIRFVKESDGIYHVWGYLEGVNAAEGDLPAADACETTSINGKVFYTVTPATDGSLILKGLDTDSYTVKEVQTEAGKNLLKSTFTVKFIAADIDSADPMTTVRDGRLRTATVKTGDTGEELDITIGIPGVDTADSYGSVNQGIASMVVNNYSVVDLRTGGEGRTLILILGGVALAGICVGFALVSRKKKSKSQ